MELKKVVEPVSITLLETNTEVFIKNKYDMVDTSAFHFKWKLEVDGFIVREGVLDVPVIPAGKSTTVRLPAFHVDAGKQWWVTVAVVLAESTPWASAGHEVAWGQFSLAPPRTIPTITPVALAPRKHDDGTVSLGNARFSARGQLLSLGAQLPVTSGCVLDIWRAPTDNDRGGDRADGRNYGSVWHDAGLHRMIHRVDGIEVHNQQLVVFTRVASASSDRGLVATYHWTATAQESVQLRVHVVPTGDWQGVPLPRMGVRLGLPRQLETISWFGRGPGDSYPDTCAAARVGLFNGTLDGWQTPYVYPQENGSRSGVQWAEFHGSERGAGLRVEYVGDDSNRHGLAIAARPWTTEALEAAQHTIDLEDSGTMWLNIDTAVHGIGTASCGPGVQPQYQLEAKEMAFDIAFRDLSGIRTKL